MFIKTNWKASRMIKWNKCTICIFGQYRKTFASWIQQFKSRRREYQLLLTLSPSYIIGTIETFDSLNFTATFSQLLRARSRLGRKVALPVLAAPPPPWERDAHKDVSSWGDFVSCSFFRRWLNRPLETFLLGQQPNRLFLEKLQNRRLQFNQKDHYTRRVTCSINSR